MLIRIVFILIFIALMSGVSFSAPGDLDPTYGGDGVVTYNNDTANYWDYGRGVAIQPDGKIVVTGSSPNSSGSNYDVLVLRYNSDGTLDTTFSEDGVVTYDNYYHTNDGGNAVAMQPDGKIVVIGWSNINYQDVLVLRYNSDGTLDTTFSEDGVATYSGLGNGSDIGFSVAVQENGKVVVVGCSYNGSNEDVLILRFNNDGTLDTTFSEDGIVTYNSTVNSNDGGYGVAIQPDGKILITGYSYDGYLNNHYEDVLVLRYNSDGTLDSTFSEDGVVLYDCGANYNYDYGFGVATQPDGKIVITGYSYDGINRNALVLRYKGDGTPDNTFSDDGIVTYNVPANPGFGGYRAAIQTDGKIVVAGGGGWNGRNSDILILRYNSDGTLDNTFGGDGVTAYNGTANGDDVGHGVALQSDGKIVVVGDGWNGSNINDVLVLRCNGNGIFDVTFGDNGTVTYNSAGNSNQYDYGYAVAIQPDGKIVVVGLSKDEAENYSNVLILRYNRNGSLDNTFGKDGAVITRSFMCADYGYGVAIQQDGKIVVTGGSWNGNNIDVLVMRFNSDGTPDTTFGSYGVILYDSGSDEEGYGVAIQTNGKIVVVGYIWSSGLPVYDALILRYNSDGTLDTTFSKDGIAKYNSRMDGADFGSAVAIHQDGKIVITGYSNTGVSTYEAFVLRYNRDGSLDNTFGEEGVVVYDDFYRDFGYGVAIQPDGKIVVAGEKYGDVLVLRYNSDGTLDRSFSTDGVVTYNSGGDDFGFALAIQPYGKIVITGGSNYNTVILRYNSNGSLDNTFGTDGVVIYGGGVYGSGIAVQPDAKIVVTGSSWDHVNDYDVLTMRLIGDKFTYANLVRPNGGEIIPSGSTYTIQWAASTEVVKFKLIYSLDSGLTWMPIPKTADFITGISYDWTVPKPWGNKKNTCLVKVKGYNSSNVKIGVDISDAPFTIEVVKLTSPDGGVAYTSGDPLTITWTTNNTKKPVTKVKLYYTKDGGSTWNSIFTFRDSNPGSYDWQVPCVRNDKASCKVKVTLFDDSGNIVGEDASNGYFTIVHTCTDISGRWNGTHTITVTCCYQGQCESETSAGVTSPFINQNDCKINWTIPINNVKRSGITWCNNLEVSGIFCSPEMLPGAISGSGAIFLINQLTASGTVNGDTINLIGWGQCSGTYQGVTFECSGRDKTVLTRSLLGITEEKQIPKEPALFMNNSLRIFGVISP